MSITPDIDPRFDQAFPVTCAKIGCKPIDLLGVMFSESGCSPSAHNQAPATIYDPKLGTTRPTLPAERYNAVGLIQFMPATLLGLGWRNGYESFKHLSASEQLPYVAAYFAPWQKSGAPWDSAGRLYQACFLPGTLASSRAPDDVLAARGGRLGFAYEANQVFDANGDGQITIAELSAAVMRNARGARWIELLDRLGIPHELVAVPDDEELETAALEGEEALLSLLASVRGVQLALVRLGYDIGPHGVDGFYGGATRAAVIAFQTDHEISVDGRVGRETRTALAIALLTSSA